MQPEQAPEQAGPITDGQRDEIMEALDGPVRQYVAGGGSDVREFVQLMSKLAGHPL